MLQEQTSLAGLPPEKQLGLALLILERMLPFLIAFSKDTGFDGTSYLRARDAVWNSLVEQAPCRGGTSPNLPKPPDTDEFSHPLTSYALNTALALTEIVEFAVDHRTEHVVEVRKLARESIDLYLNTLEPALVSTRSKGIGIEQHPLMKREERKEREDITFLITLPDKMDRKAFTALRARGQGQSPLFPLE